MTDSHIIPRSAFSCYKETVLPVSDREGVDFKQLFPGLAGVAPHCGTGAVRYIWRLQE